MDEPRQRRPQKQRAASADSAATLVDNPSRRAPVESERSARPFVPETLSLSTLRSAARDCRGCDLYKRATHVVFGSGSRQARLMLVGEQPGDREDLAGEPFVGPAGGILTKALTDAGIDPDLAYVTNAVKHFSWEPRGRRRIHKKPRASEIRACRPWLEAEMESVRPDVVVCLGATAAQSLMGSSFKVTAHRGELVESPWAGALVATIHPSAVLRAPDSEGRRIAYEGLVADLKAAARVLSRR